jgi:hypothetical protein
MVEPGVERRGRFAFFSAYDAARRNAAKGQRASSS